MNPLPKIMVIVLAILVMGLSIVIIEKCVNRTTRMTKQVRTIELAKGITMDFCWVPAGEFIIGSSAGEERRRPDENQRSVRINDGFWMGKYEVTQAQYVTITGVNPSGFPDMRQPVECVSALNALWFCEEATRRLGVKINLPTEEQWEYACRSGTMTPYYYGSYSDDESHGVCEQENGRGEFMIMLGINYRAGPRPVGQCKPNPWGLYDMYGNVWEWCLESGVGGSTNGNYVLRGGAWGMGCIDCRSAVRRKEKNSIATPGTGFRVIIPGGPE